MNQKTKSEISENKKRKVENAVDMCYSKYSVFKTMFQKHRFKRGGGNGK